MENVEVLQNEVTNEEDESKLFEFVEENPDAAEKITAPRYSYWKSVFRVFFRKKSNWVALILFVIILIFTYIYGSFLPSTFIDYEVNPNISVGETHNLSPSEAIAYFGFSFKWILGTGNFGQSLFENIWKGSQVSLSLAFVCAAINMTVGVVIGAIWGFSKKVDIIMTEIYNIIANIPYILFIAVFVMVIGSGFWSFVAALTVTPRRWSRCTPSATASPT